jgi:hypothetical protein
MRSGRSSSQHVLGSDREDVRRLLADLSDRGFPADPFAR